MNQTNTVRNLQLTMKTTQCQIPFWFVWESEKQTATCGGGRRRRWLNGNRPFLFEHLVTPSYSAVLSGWRNPTVSWLMKLKVITNEPLKREWKISSHTFQYLPVTGVACSFILFDRTNYIIIFWWCFLSLSRSTSLPFGWGIQSYEILLVDWEFDRWAQQLLSRDVFFSHAIRITSTKRNF